MAVRTNSAAAAEAAAGVFALTTASAAFAALPSLPNNEESAPARGLPRLAWDNMSPAAVKVRSSAQRSR